MGYNKEMVDGMVGIDWNRGNRWDFAKRGRKKKMERKRKEWKGGTIFINKRNGLASALQAKRGLNAHHLCVERLVNLQAFLHLRTTVQHRAVITVAHQLSYARSRHLGIF